LEKLEEGVGLLSRVKKDPAGSVVIGSRPFVLLVFLICGKKAWGERIGGLD